MIVQHYTQGWCITDGKGYPIAVSVATNGLMTVNVARKEDTVKIFYETKGEANAMLAKLREIQR